MKRGFILLLMLMLIFTSALPANATFASVNDYFDKLFITISQSAGDEIDSIGYSMLPSKIIDNLKNEYGYGAEDVSSVVRIKPSSVTVASSLVIKGANVVNDNAGYMIDYATDGLDAVIDSMAIQVIGTATQTYGGTPGKYAVYAYSMSEDMEEAFVILDEVSNIKDLASAQTIGLTLSTKLLNAEMNYINEHMPAGLGNLYALDKGEAQDLIIFAVYIDKLNVDCGLMEKGVKFYYLNKENGVYSYPNYHNAMVYSTVNIYPDDSVFYYTYDAARQSVEYAELYPTRSNILAAYAFVENAPAINASSELSVRANALMDTLTLLENTSAGETVVFADANLEFYIRTQIGKPSGTLTANDLAGVEEIYAASSGISDISGIEYCVNLKILDLSRNSIRSIEPLRGLRDLTYFAIHNNQVSDLGPLSNKQKLTKLVLWNNSIMDLSPLSALDNLKHLDVSRNDIEDITAIRELTNLEVLSIAYNNIRSIEAVRYLTKLYHFYIGGNPIYDTSPTNSYYSNIINKDF